MDMNTTFMIISLLGGLGFLVFISVAILNRLEELGIKAKGNLGPADISK